LDVDLNSVAIFAKVVEVNGFSAAARTLNIPLATVSRRVAELEDQLGVRLIERSTRSLRPTGVGLEVLRHARQAPELKEAISDTVSNHKSVVAGLLRLCAPPSIDTLLAPLVCAFQASHPEVRVQITITTEIDHHLRADIDLAFWPGPLKDLSLVARKILSYRHHLVASPAYISSHKWPQSPRDLQEHSLVAISQGSRESRWSFRNGLSGEEDQVTFVPHLSMNEFASLTRALLVGVGIGEVSSLVHPELRQSGALVEVMPEWQFPDTDLSLVHLGRHHVAGPVRLFQEFAAQVAPTLVSALSETRTSFSGKDRPLPRSSLRARVPEVSDAEARLRAGTASGC
jgi:DNA-binding transcriptional LysR family regulator